MKQQDALNILGLSGTITPEQIKAAYKRAAAKFHPDRNPAGAEMMKAVNSAYDALKDLSDTISNDDDMTAADYGDALNAALSAIIDLEGLNIEICGSWVWVTGNTKEHKAAIKAAGYKWSRPKTAWYFRPEKYKSSSRGKFSLDDIRTYHGSKQVKGKFNNRIEAA